MKRQHLILAVTVILASGIAGNAGAQPITDAHIQELIKEAARQTGAGAQAADPAQRPAAGASRPTFHIADSVCLLSADAVRHRPIGAQTEAVTSPWLPPDGPVSIGLTSGASTPDNLVGATVLRLAEFCG